MSWTDYSAAPDPGTPVCPLAELGDQPRSLLLRGPRGEFPLLVLRGSDGGLRGYVNACPHQYLPLDWRSSQILSADGSRLMCSAHGASFDRDTGQVLGGADCGLDPVPLTLCEGMVVIGA